MKKFKFSLDTVLDYKQQILESVKGEHGAILSQVREQEQVLASVWARYYACDDEFRERKSVGMSIMDAMFYEAGLRSLELEIQRETARLEDLQKQEEAKRQEMIEAKIDTSSLEKLKGKKLDLYQKAVQKDEEVLIDEFVSGARVRAG